MAGSRAGETGAGGGRGGGSPSERPLPGVAAWGRAAAAALYLGGFGYLCIVLWQSLLVSVGGLTEQATVAWQLSAQVAVFLGGVTLTAAYLGATDRDRSYLDLGVPTLRQVGLVVGGVAALYALNYGVDLLGVPLASHSVQRTAAENPEFLPALVVGSLLFVGPGEELLFRNVVQKRVVEGLGGGRIATAGGIGLASAVFAATHTLAYAGAPADAVAGTLALIFALSVVLGALYAWTRSIVVVALVHGGYDAVAFALTYWELTA